MTAGTGQRTGLVVVNYGSHDLIRANFGWTADDPSADLVVVDNFSSTAGRRAIEQVVTALGATLLALPDNAGFGVAANRGVRAVRERGCDCAIVVNPDLSVDGDGVAELGRLCRENPTCFVSPLVFGPDGRTWSEMNWIDLRVGRVRKGGTVDGWRWLSGACLGAHTDWWDRVGGFDPDYFLYWEDVDVCVRSEQLGGGLLLADGVRALHTVGGTQRTVAGKSARYYYYNCRNRLVFAARHLGPADQLRWVRHAPADVKRVISRGDPAPFQRLRHALWPAAAGFVAGLRYLATHRSRPAARPT